MTYGLYNWRWLFLAIFSAVIFYANHARSDQSIFVRVGTSEILELNDMIGRFLVGDPNIVELTPIDERSFYLVGKAYGGTTVQVFAEDKKQLLETLNVQIGPDLKVLNQAINRIDKASKINIFFDDNVLQIVGTVPDQTIKENIIETAKAFTGLEPLEAITVESARQIRLKVRFIEISRSLNGALGTRLQVLAEQSGNTLTFNEASFVGTALSTVSIVESGVDIDILLEALEEQGFAKFLAEPTLTALSGEPASFLAGGEVPITTQSSDGPITEYRPYGIQLDFTANVDKNHVITLNLSPEVSQVDYSANSSGNQPRFTTRKATTTVQMRNDQSLILAGLYQADEARGRSSIPVIGDFPGIGALFRSVNLRDSQNEVMIVITPSLSTIAKKDQFSLKKLENTRPADPGSLIDRGTIETSGYDLLSFLSGKGVEGSFGPMLSNNNEGVFNSEK